MFYTTLCVVCIADLGDTANNSQLSRLTICSTRPPEEEDFLEFSCAEFEKQQKHGFHNARLLREMSKMVGERERNSSLIDGHALGGDTSSGPRVESLIKKIHVVHLVVFSLTSSSSSSCLIHCRLWASARKSLCCLSLYQS